MEAGVTVENSDQFVPPATETLSYDADGNLLTDGRWTYTWDRENRLVKMESAYQTTPIAVPGYRLSFRYDGLSRRIEKKVETTSDGSTWTLKNWEGYVYDAWNLIMTVRFETNGAVRGRVASYVWGPDIASRAVGGAGSHWQAAGGVGGLLFVVDGSSVSAQYPASNEDAADDNFFPLMDRLGNVLAYAKVASATTPLPLRAVYDYDAFGRELRSSGPAADLVPFHFSTKFTDQESGLNYYGYRYYDPGKGRWLNRDPIGERGGKNVLTSVDNNLQHHIDLLGLDRVIVDKIHPYILVQTWDEKCCAIGWKRIDFQAHLCSVAVHGGVRLVINNLPLPPIAKSLLAMGLMEGEVKINDFDPPEQYDSDSHRYIKSGCVADRALLQAAEDNRADPPDYNTGFFNCRHFVAALAPTGLEGMQSPFTSLNPYPSINPEPEPPHEVWEFDPGPSSY